MADLKDAHDDFLRSSLLWAKDRVRSEAEFLGYLIDHRDDFERVPGRFAEMAKLSEESMAITVDLLLAYHGELCRRARA